VIEEGTGVPAGTGLFLRAAAVAVEEPGVVRVELPPGSPALERLATPTARRPLEDALGRRLGARISLAFGAASAPGDGAAAPLITAESARRDRLRRLSEEEPLLARAVQEWDLELVE
jgi:hypothetical protein